MLEPDNTIFLLFFLQLLYDCEKKYFRKKEQNSK